jgi:TctA family transporter
VDALHALIGGFAAALQPTILLYGFLGCLLGTLVGVLFVFVAWFVFDRLLGVQLGRFASFVPWP